MRGAPILAWKEPFPVWRPHETFSSSHQNRVPAPESICYCCEKKISSLTRDYGNTISQIGLATRLRTKVRLID